MSETTSERLERLGELYERVTVRPISECPSRFELDADDFHLLFHEMPYLLRVARAAEMVNSLKLEEFIRNSSPASTWAVMQLRRALRDEGE